MTDPTDGDPAETERPTSRPLLASLLALLCVAALTAGLLLTLWLHDRTEERVAVADRAAVVEATQEFVETWNTFRPKDASSYVDRVGKLLTTKFGTEFRDASKAVVDGIVQQRLFSKGQVVEDGDGLPLVGIATMDGDSAEVLVVADATRVANRQRVLRHWRWQVSLRKVDGDWLVDSFEDA